MNIEERNIIMKKYIFTPLLLVLVFAFALAVTSYASFEDVELLPVTVTIDGETAEIDAILRDGVTYVPLRSFCDLMGGSTITWDAPSNTASVKTVGLDISVTQGNRYITVNDRIFYCAEGVYLTSGTLYVPVRAIAKAYGMEVEWKTNSGRCVGTVALTSTGRRAEPASDVYDADVLYWLSRIISAEARGESLEGQIAVGNVVLNRTRSDEFPDTVYDVIFDRKFGVQFSPVSIGTIYDEPAESSIIAAKICLEGYTISDRILYFLNISLSKSLWVSKNRDYVMTLGSHTFYS